MRPLWGTAGWRAAFPFRAMTGQALAVLDDGIGNAADDPGNTPDWADVVAKYADVIYTMAYRLTGDDEDARDLAQDVLIRLHRGLARYREGNFEGWLYRTTVNAFRDRLRKRKRLREELLPDEPPGMTTEGIVEEAVASQELHDIVQRALIRLPPEYREAVVLRDLEGRSYEEIAEILQVPSGTVRSRIHRGREALRQLLEHYVEEPDETRKPPETGP